MKKFYLTRTVETNWVEWRKQSVTDDYTHIRPESLKWRMGIEKVRAKELFGIDLEPNSKYVVTVKVRRCEG